MSVSALTPQEKNVLQLLSKGLLYKEIANNLNIKIDTVKKHARNIYNKLNVRNRTEAAILVYSKN